MEHSLWGMRCAEKMRNAEGASAEHDQFSASPDKRSDRRGGAHCAGGFTRKMSGEDPGGSAPTRFARGRRRMGLVTELGAYRVQGKTAVTARQLLDDARALEDAGAFAIVLEVVPREIASLITESISIPTIGIGAGAGCDIQVLVLHDMLGLSFGKLARFVRPYANLHQVITEAVTQYADDVRAGTYPSEAESYALPAEAAEELKLEKPKARKIVNSES